MAKALLGYVGGSDPRLVYELRRLQQRVQDLETELLRLQAEYDHLSATVDANHLDSTPDSAAALDRGDDVRTVTPEPALA
jgi:hypothetical protein